MFGEIFAACLLAYLTGWLLVNLLFNRVLARATRNAERMERLKVKGYEGIATAVADELERRAEGHTR